MDEQFMDTIKSFSVQDILQEHGPTASTSQRLATARSRTFDLSRPPIAITGSSRSQQSIGKVDDNEITTLASYRPESAAFTFSFNRPKTGRTSRGPPPSARRDRGGWDARDAPLNSARPPTSMRGNRSQAPDEAMEFIPDLDEVREEDLTQTVASAPMYEVQRMTSLKELDAELLQSKPFSVVDGVNLRKLCRFLVPEKELIEHDESWTWDRLYTEIISTSELSHLVRYQKKTMDMDTESLSSKVPQ